MIFPNMSNFVGYNFYILGRLFPIAYIAIHYVKIISSFKLFFNLIPPFTPSPGASKSDLLYER